MKRNLLLVIMIIGIYACKPTAQKSIPVVPTSSVKMKKISKTVSEWKTILSPKAFYVLREKGTESPFTGTYWDNKKDGEYQCSACALPLFDSSTKFKSGTGWPSFYDVVNANHIYEDTDYNLGYARTELTCNRCGGHLGHVFSDGPKPTGLRYCINSISLKFEERKGIK